MAQNFLSAVRSNPRIGGYVRHLEVDHSTYPGGDARISDDECIAHILPTLTGLSHLTMSGEPVSRWETFSASSQSALESVLASPLLHSIEIGAIDGFPSDIVKAPSVKHLSCINTILPPSRNNETGEARLDQKVPNARPILNLLTTKYLNSIGCNHIWSAFNLRHLVKFGFTVRQFGQLDDLSRILKASARSLETVTIYLEILSAPSIFHSGAIFFPPSLFLVIVDLSSLRRMKTHIIDTNVMVSSFGDASVYSTRIPWLAKCLQTLPDSTSNSLSEIFLNVNFTLMEDGLPEGSFAQIPWENLVDVVLSPKLSGIRQIHIKVSDDNQLLPSHFMDVLQQDTSLSKLREKGILSLTNGISSVEKNLALLDTML